MAILPASHTDTQTDTRETIEPELHLCGAILRQAVRDLDHDPPAIRAEAPAHDAVTGDGEMPTIPSAALTFLLCCCLLVGACGYPPRVYSVEDGTSCWNTPPPLPSYLLCKSTRRFLAIPPRPPTQGYPPLSDDGHVS
jgi:hypothetical protein